MNLKNTLWAVALGSMVSGCAMNDISTVSVVDNHSTQVSTQVTDWVRENILDIIEDWYNLQATYGQIDLCRRNGYGSDVMCKPNYTSYDIQKDSLKFRTTLKSVFDFGKLFIIPRTDKENYGVEDFWTYPTKNQNWKVSWDCEDYVIYFMRELEDRGIPDFSLRPIRVVTEKWEWHLILWVIVSNWKWMYILDNRREKVFFIRDFQTLVNKKWYSLKAITGNVGVTSWKALDPTEILRFDYTGIFKDIFKN